MRCVLGLYWFRVTEACECLGHVPGHRHAHCAVDVVPGKREAAAESAFPVCCDGVQLFKGFGEVFGVFFANVFHAKVVDHETEGDRSGFVREETRSVRRRRVTLGFQVEGQLCVGDDSGLR